MTNPVSQVAASLRVGWKTWLMFIVAAAIIYLILRYAAKGADKLDSVVTGAYQGARSGVSNATNEAVASDIMG